MKLQSTRQVWLVGAGLTCLVTWSPAFWVRCPAVTMLPMLIFIGGSPIFIFHWAPQIRQPTLLTHHTSSDTPPSDLMDMVTLCPKQGRVSIVPPHSTLSQPSSPPLWPYPKSPTDDPLARMARRSQVKSGPCWIEESILVLVLFT